MKLENLDKAAGLKRQRDALVDQRDAAVAHDRYAVAGVDEGPRLYAPEPFVYATKYGAETDVRFWRAIKEVVAQHFESQIDEIDKQLRALGVENAEWSGQ